MYLLNMNKIPLKLQSKVNIEWNCHRLVFVRYSITRASEYTKGSWKNNSL